MSTNYEDSYRPEIILSPEDKEILKKVSQAYRDGLKTLDTGYPLLKGLTPMQFAERGRAQFLGIELPQLSILSPDVYIQFLNFTKTNIRQLLATFASQGVKTHVSAHNLNKKFYSQRMSRIGQAIFEYWLNKRDNGVNDSDKFLDSAMEATVTGTCFEFNGFSMRQKKKRKLISHDIVTGKSEWEEDMVVEHMGIDSQIVAIEDLLLPNPFLPIQDQPYIVWRRIIDVATFETMYSGHSKLNQVEGGKYFEYAEREIFFDVPRDLDSREVELVTYYDKFNNVQIIIANGVIMEDDVIPFEHGEYPFTRKVFGELSGKFFMYGDSFPNLIGGEQGLINYLWTLMAHQQKWGSTPFIVARDGSFGKDQEDIEAMTVMQVNEMDDFRIEKTPSVDGGAISMIGKLQEFIRDFSGNLSGGSDLFTPSGGKVQATQLMMAQEQAQKSAGFSMYYIQRGELQKKTQQFHNCKQFTSLPNMYAISGENSLTDVYDFKFDTIAVDNIQLERTKRGRMIVQMVDQSSDGFDPDKISEELQILKEAEYENGAKNVDAVAVDIKQLSRVEWTIKVEELSTHLQNQAIEIEKRELAWQKSLEATQMGIQINLQSVFEWKMQPYDIDDDILFGQTEQMGVQLPQEEGTNEGQGAPLAQAIQDPNIA